MRTEFELDEQIKAYDKLLLNELNPEQISDSLALKAAEHWMLDMERDVALLTERWLLMCGEKKYHREYLCSHLKRHIGISGSLQKMLLRYENMLCGATLAIKEVCLQIYRVLGDCLTGLQLCLQQELEQLAEVTGLNAGPAYEEMSLQESLEEQEYKRGFGKFRLVTRHDLRIIALLWGVMLEAGVYVCNHGDKKKIFSFLARHLRLEYSEEEPISRDYLLNQSTSKDREILDAARELMLKMLAYIDWVIVLVTKGRK